MIQRIFEGTVLFDVLCYTRHLMYVMTIWRHSLRHLHTGYNGILVARSLVASIMFWRSLFDRWSFNHGIVCPVPAYGFWLLLWYLQTFLVKVVREYSFSFERSIFVCSQSILFIFSKVHMVCRENDIVLIAAQDQKMFGT